MKPKAHQMYDLMMKQWDTSDNNHWVIRYFMYYGRMANGRGMIKDGPYKKTLKFIQNQLEKKQRNKNEDEILKLSKEDIWRKRSLS